MRISIRSWPVAAAIFVGLAACGGKPHARGAAGDVGGWHFSSNAVAALVRVQLAADTCATPDGADVDVDVAVSFGADGRAMAVEATPVRGGDANVKACIVGLVRELTIPAGDGEGAGARVMIFVGRDGVGRAKSQPFDRGAASRTLADAEVRMHRECRGSSDGHIKVQFVNDGSVASAKVDDSEHAGTPAAACVEEAYRKCRMPMFGGSPVAVGKAFHLR